MTSASTEGELAARCEHLERDLEAMERSFSRVSARCERLEAHLSNVEAAHRSLETWAERRCEGLDERLGRLEKRLERR